MDTMQSHSPSLVLLRKNNRAVPVCGKSLQSALWASALVDVVLNRGEEMPLPTSRTGGVKRIRITEKTLVRFLLDVYGSEPATVAEAIMALRKFDLVKAAWLNRVLRKNSELTALARAVHTELTGEEYQDPTGRAG
jgi:hypothetical protein